MRLRLFLRRHGAPGAALALAALLAGCGAGAGDERGRMMDRCMRSTGRATGDADQARAMCECTADRLAARGMSAIDMLRNPEGRDIARQCAAEAGIPTAV